MQKGGLPLNRKFIVFSLYLFTSLCLFSVGFSSWTICMGSKLTASGNIVAENIETAEKYICPNVKLGDGEAVDTFDYNSKSFVTYVQDPLDSSKLVPSKTNVTSVTYYYILELASIKEDLKSGDFITVTFRYSDVSSPCNLISTYMANPVITCDEGKTIEISNYNNTNNICSFKIMADRLIEYANEGLIKLNISIKYTFNYTGSNFTNDVYNYLVNENFYFIMKTEVTCNE